MTEKFDNFVIKTLKENGMAVAGVLGNDGAYDTSDPRNPTVLGPMQRRASFKKKRRKVDSGYLTV